MSSTRPPLAKGIGIERLEAYLENGRERFIADLGEALRIPSVSAQTKHRDDVRRCAQHVASHLKALGMSRAELMETAGHPVVYAEWLGAPGKPTALFYGHYDVQPPEPLELWKSPPFEPTVRDDKIYARGACDNKGQVYMHLKAIEAHMKVNGGLPINLKMIIEGEEEVGSKHLEPFLQEHRQMLDADVIVVSDTSMLGPGQPALTYGLRGLLYAEIEITGPSRDLHSGEFGGAVQNPAHALAIVIAALKDGDGRITVPGFYDRVRKLSPAERKELADVGFDEAGFIRESGAPEAYGERGFSTVERIWVRPTLDVNGMWSGYIGDGAKTVLPSVASAKISMRMVPDQNPEEIYAAFEAYVRRLAPPGVKLEIGRHSASWPFISDPAHPMLEAARRALERAWGKPAKMIREGGSVPVLAMFQKTYDVPFILMGFGLHDDQVHAPNEKFSLSSFFGGIRSAAYLYEELARTSV